MDSYGDANIRPVFALVELAKYYEHKIKDYDRAAKATQKALEIAYKKIPWWDLH